jgi:hypothetical protein
MKAIVEGLQLLLQGLITWCRAAAAPAQTARSILSMTESERTAILMAVWLWSIMISVLFQGPIYKLYGIEWTDIGFLLPYVLMTSLATLLIAVAMHLALRLFRVPSSLSDTLSMFVMTVTVYSPVSTFLGLPAQANMINTLSTIKSLNLSFWGVIQRYYSEMVSRGSQSDPLGDVQFVIIPIGFVFSLCSLAIFAECIVQQYKAERFKTLVAVGVGTTLLVIPIYALTFFIHLLVWGYLKLA